MKDKRAIFITGTDTDVGKTIATYVLGLLFQNTGLDIGVMKPVQCAGNDAEFLANNLDSKDLFEDVNPHYLDEPLSPNLAFKRAGKKFNKSKVLKSFHKIKESHDLTLVEGAGGFLVPLTDQYLVYDLVNDLELDVIVVSRLGLGTINHTLLTIKQIQDAGLNVLGVVFSKTDKANGGIPGETNPKIIKKISGVPVLGVIPYLNDLDSKSVLNKCKGIIKIPKFFSSKRAKLTKRLQQVDKEHVWHPFAQMKDWLKEEQLIIDQAKGSYLIDAQGNKYIDGVSSLWVNVHGHRNREIDQALKNQVNKLSHSTLLGLGNTPSIELAQKLVEITPKELEKVFYSDSGSTAVEIAIKMA